MKNFKKLNKSEMKKIAGGLSGFCPEGLCFNPIIQACDWPSSDCMEEDDGPCTLTCGSGANITSCTSTVGKCLRPPAHELQAWIQCDSNVYSCPA